MTSQLKSKLIERGYKATEIKDPVWGQTILTSKSHKKTNPLVIPLKYYDNNSLIRQTVLSNWHLISSDPTLSQSFAMKPMIANKKNQSLANKLVRAKIKTPLTIMDPRLQSKLHRLDPPPNIQTNIPNLFPKVYTMAKCKRPRCTVCPKLRLTERIYNKLCKVNVIIPRYKDHWPVMTRVVYAVKCHEAYVGQARIAQHLTKITHHMSHHFNKSHNIKHFNVFAFGKDWRLNTQLKGCKRDILDQDPTTLWNELPHTTRRLK